MKATGDIFSRLPDSIARFDSAGRFLFINPPFEAMLNMSGAQLRGKTLVEAGADAELAEYWTDRVLGVFRTGKVASHELAFRRSMESALWQTRLLPEVDRRGRIRSVLSISWELDAAQGRRPFAHWKQAVLEMITGASPLPSIFDSICKIADWELPGVGCAVMRVERSGSRLSVAAAPALPGAFSESIEGMEIGLHEAACGAAACQKTRVVSSDIAADPNWSRYRETASQAGVKSCISTPILSHDGHILGTFAIYRNKVALPSAHELLQAKMSADLAGIAIERNQAQETLERSESHYRKLIENTHDIVAIVDENDRVEYVNPSVRTILGYEPHDIVGLSALDLIAETDAPKLSILRDQTMGQQRIEVTARHRDGTSRILDVVAAQLNSGTGGARVITARDITDEKRTLSDYLRLHAALETAAHEWRVTFDAVPTPVVILDGEQTVRRLNRAAMLEIGHSFGEILGMRLSDIPGEPWQSGAAILEGIRDAGSPAMCQTRDKSNGRTWDLAANRIARGDGPEWNVIIAREITNLISLQESLRRSETLAAMGTLVAGVAHEVRNPLFAVSATIDAFEAQFQNVEDFKPYMAVLRGELRRLGALMEGLLDYGRPPFLRLAEVSIIETIDESIAHCQSLAQSSQIAVERICDLPDDRLVIDPLRIKQVFSNLIENAIQQSPKGGRVGIEISVVNDSDGKFVVCVISDAGPGIRDVDLPRLFEPFFSRRRGGTGLGLSIVQQIVEQHGGSVAAANKLSGGAAVTIRLPVETAMP